MADDELLDGFLDARLPAEAFRHREHVRVVWLLLERRPLLDALASFVEGLQRFAAAKGVPHLYHATITFAFFFLINERRARLGSQQDWAAFAEHNSDLLTWRGGLLEAYYAPAVLDSDLARRTFVLPRPEAVTARAASEGNA